MRLEEGIEALRGRVFHGRLDAEYKGEIASQRGENDGGGGQWRLALDKRVQVAGEREGSIGDEEISERHGERKERPVRELEKF